VFLPNGTVCNLPGSPTCTATLVQVFIKVYKAPTATYIVAVFIGNGGTVLNVGVPVRATRAARRLLLPPLQAHSTRARTRALACALNPPSPLTLLPLPRLAPAARS
jgi:hypothetical protein